MANHTLIYIFRITPEPQCGPLALGDLKVFLSVFVEAKILLASGAVTPASVQRSKFGSLVPPGESGTSRFV